MTLADIARRAVRGFHPDARMRIDQVEMNGESCHVEITALYPPGADREPLAIVIDTDDSTLAS